LSNRDRRPEERDQRHAHYETHRLPSHVKRVDENALIRSFHYAISGIVYATRTQRNMRIHFLLGVFVLIGMLMLRLQRVYVIILIVLVALMLALELLNTAIESVVDLLTVVHHPLAKIAKDTAAGAVLIMAIGSTVVGYMIFYEGITSGGERVYRLLSQVPAAAIFVALAVVAIATIFSKAFFRHGTPLQGGAVSGHASLAFCAATMLVLLAPHPLLAVLAYFLAFMVAQSRVEGGIHSIYEVIFGALLGSSVSLGLFLLVHLPKLIP
jgi:diacylglycerol kinase (ATP)